MAAGLMFGGAVSTASAAEKALTRAASDARSKTIVEERRAKLRQALADEWKNHEFTNGEYRMKFWDTIYGPKEAPADGRSLYISLHGGGGAPPEVNDQQWENQKRLYSPAEGLYFVPVPRPTAGTCGIRNTWTISCARLSPPPCFSKA